MSVTQGRCTAGFVAALLLVIVAGAAFEARAAGAAESCPNRAVARSAFPPAQAVGLALRLAIVERAPRKELAPGHCGSWWATYLDRRKAPRVSVVVGITAYRTSLQALRALGVPNGGPIEILASGVKQRAARDGSTVVTVVGNVAVTSSGASRTVGRQLKLHRIARDRLLAQA